MQLLDEVGHGLSMDVACGGRQGRVDVRVGVHPQHTQVLLGCRMAMDGAYCQTTVNDTNRSERSHQMYWPWAMSERIYVEGYIYLNAEFDIRKVN